MTLLVPRKGAQPFSFIEGSAFDVKILTRSIAPQPLAQFLFFRRRFLTNSSRFRRHRTHTLSQRRRYRLLHRPQLVLLP